MEREKRLRPGFDRRSVNVFLLYFPRDRMAAALPKNFGADRDRMLAMLRSGQTTCMAKLFKKGNEIRAAVILFPAHHSRATLRACAVEELTQIMGLANASTIVADSITNDKSPFKIGRESRRVKVRK